jgi:hypothetical protein
MSRRKKPWARFEISGVQANGEVRFDIAYNKAFIRNLDRQGLTGTTDDETVQNFLFGTFLAPKAIFDELEQESINSLAHPNLSKETNILKR